MDSAADINIPPARDEDDDDVQCALTVAHACSERGDGNEALKWLRRASQAAAENDDVMRAIELSKAVAGAEAAKAAAKADPVKSSPAAPLPLRRPAPPLNENTPSRLAPVRPRQVSSRQTPPATPIAHTRIDRPTPQPPPPQRRASRQRAPSDNLIPKRASLRPGASRPGEPRRQPEPTRPEASSDLEQTQPRLIAPTPEQLRSLPMPEFDHAPLADDFDLDGPTEIRQRHVPRQSVTRASDPTGQRAWDSNPGSLDPESTDEAEPPTIRGEAVGVGLGEAGLGAAGLGDVSPLDVGALSATRIAVYPGMSGRPEVVFLPAGEAPPAGAAVALIVPTSSDDAALLAAMIRVFEQDRAAG